MRGIFSFLFVMMSYLQTYAQCAQMGNKLVGTGAIGQAYQGYSVSISSDGKTALIGGHYDNSNQGAVWIFTLNGNNFTQLGNKLVANDASGDHPFQGASVSLSADGKTALVGGNQDNFHIGAAWIYTFNGSNYVQLGSKLIGNDATGTSIYQGGSVSLSEDGRTAMVGGTGDNSDQGAAWIYTLSGNSFKQVGSKLVGTNAIGTAEQGFSVSLSSDGKTALMGGAYDNTGVGAAWVFTFDGINYVQAGDKIVSPYTTGAAQIGGSVSLSADGKTAAIGGFYDLIGLGAVWIYTFNGTNFVEFDKLTGIDVSERPVYQGYSVSLSYDGKTVLVGGYKDNSGQGATWIYTFSGHNYVQAGNKLVGSDIIGDSGQGISVSISGDGKTALVGGYNDNFNQGAVWVYYCSSIQDPTSILDFSELENRSVFDVFPNPSCGTFTIKQSEALKGEPLIVEIYNNLGKRIKTVSEGETNLSSGFYLLRSGMYSKKLIIE